MNVAPQEGEEGKTSTPSPLPDHTTDGVVEVMEDVEESSLSLSSLPLPEKVLSSDVSGF